ncbi:hypothetical protein Tco_0360135 [Tanacetum coccineum]
MSLWLAIISDMQPGFQNEESMSPKRRLVTVIQKRTKIKAKRTKPSTGMERARDYEFDGVDCADTMADVNVNAPAKQAPAMAPPTRTDDQILPRSRWNGVTRMFFRTLSAVVTNDMFQPWRALTTIINLCLTGKTSAFERPRAPVLQILWGVVNRAHIDYAERMWEEFTQSIHSFIEDKKNLALNTQGKKKANPLMIPSVRFTKLIIHHLQSKHKFHLRPDSLLHLPYEEYVLGYLKFSAKGTKRELIDEFVDEGVPDKEPVYGEEEADTQRAIEESLKEVHDAHRGPLPPVVIREPDSRKFQRLQMIQKGHDESSSLYAELGLTNSEMESDEEVPGTDVGDQDEGQAGPNPGIQDEGQAGSNHVDAVVSQPQSNHVVHAGANREHLDLEVTDTSIQQNPEQMDEEFTTTAYPNVQENLKLPTEDQWT